MAGELCFKTRGVDKRRAAKPTAAHAYLDQGTGSMIIQMIIGCIAADVLKPKFYRHKVTAFLGTAKKASSDD